MFLSVIIPTRNRARHLMRALSSLNEQTCEAESFEILVVDNGSTDNTREVCEAYRSLFPNFQYLYDSRPGLHAGRHLGMKRAKADILVYADDDISAFPTWLESIAYGFQDPRVALVGGKNLPLFELDPPRWLTDMWEKPRTDGRILGYLSIMDLGDQIKEITPFLVFGCNFSVRKNVIYEAGGFHPDAMPEELIRYRGDGETHISQYIFEHGYLT
ncbi:MAG: glycosyltransferase family A protein, partial [Deltaproteobacteria bacterium]